MLHKIVRKVSTKRIFQRGLVNDFAQWECPPFSQISHLRGAPGARAPTHFARFHIFGGCPAPARPPLLPDFTSSGGTRRLRAHPFCPISHLRGGARRRNALPAYLPGLPMKSKSKLPARRKPKTKTENKKLPARQKQGLDKSPVSVYIGNISLVATNKRRL